MAEISVDEIYDRALRLSDEDRGKLATALIASLGPGPAEKDQGYDEAWAEEIERRLVEIEEGRAESISWEEVKAHSMAVLDEECHAEILRRSDAVRDGLETTQSAEEFEADMRNYLAELRSKRSVD